MISYILYIIGSLCFLLGSILAIIEKLKGA